MWLRSLLAAARHAACNEALCSCAQIASSSMAVRRAIKRKYSSRRVRILAHVKRDASHFQHFSSDLWSAVSATHRPLEVSTRWCARRPNCEPACSACGV